MIVDLRAEMVAQGDFAVERAGIAGAALGEALRSQLIAEMATIRRGLRSLEARAERSTGDRAVLPLHPRRSL